MFHNHEEFAAADEAEVLAGGGLDGRGVALQPVDLFAHGGIFMLQLVEARGGLPEIARRPEPANQTVIAHHGLEKQHAAHKNQGSASPQTLCPSLSQCREGVGGRGRSHCVRKVPDVD